MSIVAKDLNRIANPEETLPGFLAHNDQPRIGFEQEGHLVDSITKEAITPDRFYELAQHVEISVEAAANEFEVRSDKPFTLDQSANEAAEELETKMQAVQEHASVLGMDQLPYSILPWSDFRDLTSTHIHKGPNPRPTRFIDFFMGTNPACARNFITVAGIQSSATFKTPEDTLRYFNRMAHLSPLLSAVMSHVPPYTVLDEGRFGAVRTNLTLDRRLQTAGGPHKAFPGLSGVNKIDSGNAERFMRAWNDAVWDTPIFAYYDPQDENEYNRLKHFEPKGEMVSFRNLPEHLKTRENFNMAGSIQYGLLTMSALPADEAGLIKRRVEARFFDTGPGNSRIVAGLGFALMGDEDFGEAVDRFVQDSGYTPSNPKASIRKLTATVDAVSKLSFSSLGDLPYGDSNLGEAALRFHKQVTEPFLSKHLELEALDYYCRASTTPALMYRAHDGDNVVKTAELIGRITSSEAVGLISEPHI